MSDVQILLDRCRQSGPDTYAVFEQLLNDLEQPDRRVAARMLLQGLFDAWSDSPDDDFSQSHHFLFRRMSVNTSAEPSRDIIVLEFPSTFSPEAWSFTFYEGLSRYPLDEFHDRRVVELGCGNGWITIALALRYRPSQVIGVDINPRAVLCSKINVWLNGLDAVGEPLIEDGFRLIDQVEFHVSDLLSVLAESGPFDRIIGCIPQVLSPDPDALSRIASTQSSDNELHALSNYASAQGQVEDQFGLGLIARAVEDSVELLRPTGKLVFNIGGRPGRQVLDRLFRRRGLVVEPVWQTRVEQAKDTDILSLVEIEANSPHRFEFFMNVSGGEPISASTALRFAQAGGSIHHALTVYEAKLAFPVPTRSIIRAIRSEGLEVAHSAMDLSFDHREVAEERLSFLADFLTDVKSGCFPYQNVEGDGKFRQSIATFLQSYFQAEVSIEQVFVSVSRQQLLRSLLAQYRPATTLIDDRLSRLLGRQSFSQLIDAPPVADQLCRLARRLSPNAVALTMTPADGRSSEAFRQLIDQTRTIGALLILDISDILDLSSAPLSNGVFEFLSNNPQPEHVVLIGGLVRNRVYSDLEVGFCISRSARLHSHLAGSAELTYSRAPLIAQRFYHRLIEELLFFQRPDRVAAQPAPLTRGDGQMFSLNENAREAFKHPAIATQSLPLRPDSCRMDYGENELDAPASLNSALAEAFVRQNVTASELDCDDEVHALAGGRFGQSVADFQVRYGCGIAPLFSSVMEHCRDQGGTLILPNGAYGQFAACATFHGVDTAALPTLCENGFKMDAIEVAETMSRFERPWLFLNAPIVNPSGAVYRPIEVQSILSVASRHNARVVIDSVFCGLEMTAAARYEIEHWPKTVILGGVSKEFAAAGLRFGYALTNDSEINESIGARRLDVPHGTHFFAVKRLFGKQLQGDAALVEELEGQRQRLRKRAETLARVLSESGWEVLVPEGGLFLIARPIGLQGRTVRYVTEQGEKEVLLSAGTIAEAAFYTTGLLFNDPVWTGIPGFCRFVISAKTEEFEQGLKKIEEFERLTRA